MSRTRLAIVLVAIELVGCERLWDLANRGSAVADVRAILSLASTPDSTLTCHMLGTTRDVDCRLRASALTVQGLVTALTLSRVDPGAPDGLARFVEQHAPPEIASPPKNLEAFAVTGRPTVLRLGSGSAFEYLILFHDTATDRVWLRLSYAYG